MNEHPERVRRGKRFPDDFDIFAYGPDRETIEEFAATEAAGKSGKEPTGREINVLWDLIGAFPADGNRVHRVPREVHDLMGEWHPCLEGRPGWAFSGKEE